MNADELIEHLGLLPHPEGGAYRETYRHAPAEGGRGAGTAIYFLLRRGEKSRFHRVDADEIWHFYAGAPLTLLTKGPGDGSVLERTLGVNFSRGEQAQLLVPAGHYQAAESRGDFTLVGCTVTPAFEFSGFELLPEGAQP